jgi:hypothetical protein
VPGEKTGTAAESKGRIGGQMKRVGAHGNGEESTTGGRPLEDGQIREDGQTATTRAKDEGNRSGGPEGGQEKRRTVGTPKRGRPPGGAGLGGNERIVTCQNSLTISWGRLI